MSRARARWREPPQAPASRPTADFSGIGATPNPRRPTSPARAGDKRRAKHFRTRSSCVPRWCSARRTILQSFRRARAPFAGLAFVCGRRDPSAASLCRRRRRAAACGALRVGESRRGLRARRSENDDAARSGRAHAARDRSPPSADRPSPWSSRWIARRQSSPRKATFGLFPKLLTTTRDQVDLLASDNVVSAEAEAEGRVLSGARRRAAGGRGDHSVLSARFRRTGQYEVQRSA